MIAEALLTATCRECAKEFTQPARYYRGPTKSRTPKFCSAKCWYDSQRGKRRVEPKPYLYKRKPHVQHTCAECGLIFTKAPCFVGRRFCGNACARKYQTEHAIPFKCRACGKSCNPPNKTRRVYCSNECRSLHQKGENHPCYRGKRKANRGPDWKDQAHLARERDGNRCQSCHVTTKQRLSVDHIVPYRMAKVFWEEFPIGPKPNDLRNLTSLCRSCHSKKTPIERRLLDGDVIGFIQEAKRVVDYDVLMVAMELYGLSRGSRR